ncbi:unnamed protein product [Eretmochelys imbricata]
MFMAEQSKEEQKQGLSAEKLMRKASKDVCRLREQNQKVPVEVQSFRLLQGEDSLLHKSEDQHTIPTSR